MRVPLDAQAGDADPVRRPDRGARRRYGDKEILEDQDRKPLTYTDLIRAAFVLGRKIAAMTEPGERVGILLPSSAWAWSSPSSACTPSAACRPC